MARRCPEGHSPARRGSRAEKKRRAPALGSRSTCKGTGSRIRGSPPGRRCCWVLAGGASSPLCFQHFDPSWSHHVAKASGFLSLPSKASATQAASPGTADTSGCPAKKHFFSSSPPAREDKESFSTSDSSEEDSQAFSLGACVIPPCERGVGCCGLLDMSWDTHTHTLRPCLLGSGKRCAFPTQRSSVFPSSSEACSRHASLENCMGRGRAG